MESSVESAPPAASHQASISPQSPLIQPTQPAHFSQWLPSSQPRVQIRQQSEYQPDTKPYDNDAPNLDLRTYDRKLRLTRLWLRLFSTTILVIGIILFLVMSKKGYCRWDTYWSYYRKNHYRTVYTCASDWNNFGVLVCVPVMSFALLWNMAEFITCCANKRGAHPGIHIAFDLFSFFLLVGGGITEAMSLGWYNGKLGRTGVAMCVLAGIVHFILFIMACVATHRRRRFYHYQLLRATRFQSHRMSTFAPSATSLIQPPPGTAYLIPVPSGGLPMVHQNGQMYYAIGQIPAKPEPITGFYSGSSNGGSNTQLAPIREGQAVEATPSEYSGTTAAPHTLPSGVSTPPSMPTQLVPRRPVDPDVSGSMSMYQSVPSRRPTSTVASMMSEVGGPEKMTPETMRELNLVPPDQLRRSSQNFSRPLSRDQMDSGVTSPARTSLYSP